MRACMGCLRCSSDLSLPSSRPASGVGSATATSIADDLPARAEVVVTATRVPTPIDEVLAPVIVIDQDAIDRSAPADATDLLRFHAGLDIGRNGGPGQTTSVFIRGADSNHTLVLVDGVRMNPGTIGLAALQNIPPDMIERIEVVKGPRSALWGSDAIGGVINVITRRGTRDGWSAEAGYGDYDTRKASLNGGVPLGSSADFDFGVSWIDSNGFPTPQRRRRSIAVTTTSAPAPACAATSATRNSRCATGARRARPSTPDFFARAGRPGLQRLDDGRRNQPAGHGARAGQRGREPLRRQHRPEPAAVPGRTEGLPAHEARHGRRVLRLDGIPGPVARCRRDVLAREGEQLVVRRRVRGRHELAEPLRPGPHRVRPAQRAARARLHRSRNGGRRVDVERRVRLCASPRRPACTDSPAAAFARPTPPTAMGSAAIRT